MCYLWKNGEAQRRVSLTVIFVHRWHRAPRVRLAGTADEFKPAHQDLAL